MNVFGKSPRSQVANHKRVAAEDRWSPQFGSPPRSRRKGSRVEAERRRFDRQQEVAAKELRASWVVDPFKVHDMPWVPPAPVVAAPAAWSNLEPVVAQVVEIGGLGMDYVVAVLQDQVFDLWDTIYVVSGREYGAGARLSDRSLAALLGRVFCCAECKHWRRTTQAGMVVTSLVQSVRCLDCRKVAAGNTRGGYFRDAVGSPKGCARKHGYEPERNSLGQRMDDVMSELVDDPVWGVDLELADEMEAEVEDKALEGRAHFAVAKLNAGVNMVQRESGLIRNEDVKPRTVLTKVMRERMKEVMEDRKKEGPSVVRSKKEVKKEARMVLNHDRGRECFCARCVERRG